MKQVLDRQVVAAPPAQGTRLLSAPAKVARQISLVRNQLEETACLVGRLRLTTPENTQIPCCQLDNSYLLSGNVKKKLNFILCESSVAPIQLVKTAQMVWCM